MANRHILQTQLEDYSAQQLYPMHMPGHKRSLSPAPGLALGWDVTEVEGVDDLHAACGILADAMARTARLVGAQRTWYLVNGSTCGLLAGIRSLAPAGSHIIAARNCHKAVYHAIELGNLVPHWLVPPVDEGFGIYGSIPPEDVEAALEACPKAACVVLTSPTYEGVISNIATIAKICHAHHVPLLVDEAHGAHLGLSEHCPESAVKLGADLVVQSAHKTLPSLTQTAFLHLPLGSMANPEEVDRQLDIFETSSPSYPLLASLDGCTGILKDEGDILFTLWEDMLSTFDKITEPLQHLKVLCHGKDNIENHPAIFGFDPGKLVVCTADTHYTGTELARILRNRFGFETEMACGQITLAMTSIADQKQAITSFADALLILDREAEAAEHAVACALPVPGRAKYTIANALAHSALDIAADEAVGKVCGEYIWAYPPGVPLIAPGEAVTRKFLAACAELVQSGTQLHHSHCKKAGFLHVLS